MISVRRLVYVGALAAVAISAIVYFRFSSSVPVSLAAAARGPAVRAVYATGNVEPVYWAKVTPMAKGRILDMCLCEGRAVKRGAFLARLDETEVRAQLLELERREQFLAEDVARYRALIPKNFVSRQNYERSVSEHGQAQAAVAAAKKRLEEMRLVSPIDGIVLRRDGEIGEIAEPGQTLFWIGRPKPLWIVAEVDEEDIPLVRQGQTTLVKADAFPHEVLMGTVDQITPKGDPVNKSYRVRIVLPEDTPLHIGMTTEINIVVEKKPDALLVPATAMRGARMFVAKDGRAEERAVAIGISGDGKVEVTRGIDEGEQVVINPPPTLKAGDRLRPRKE